MKNLLLGVMKKIKSQYELNCCMFSEQMLSIVGILVLHVNYFRFDEVAACKDTIRSFFTWHYRSIRQIQCFLLLWIQKSTSGYKNLII